MDIGPGDFVECIASRDASFAKSAEMARRMGTAAICAGRLYTVKETVGTIFYSNGTSVTAPCLVLDQEDTHWTAFNGSMGSWALGFFRKVYTPRQELFSALLEPINLEEEDA